MSKIPRPVLIGVGILVVGLIAYGLYKLIATNANNSRSSRYNANREHTYEGGGHGHGHDKAVVILFFADWCPHCVKAKPEWEHAKAELEGKRINGRTVVFVEYDCSSEDSDSVAKRQEYGVEGFPTIKLDRNGTIVNFDGRVTTANIVEFVRTSA